MKDVKLLKNIENQHVINNALSNILNFPSFPGSASLFWAQASIGSQSNGQHNGKKQIPGNEVNIQMLQGLHKFAEKKPETVNRQP
jgi:hypothetical protein